MPGKTKKRKQQGFTILEVMVVVIIISMLAAGVSLAYMKRLESARKMNTQANIIKIVEQVDMYKMMEKSYPEELKDLVPDYIKDATTIKDAWGNEYKYVLPGDNGAFDIISGGPDKDINTPNDNINSWEVNAAEEKK